MLNKREDPPIREGQNVMELRIRSIDFKAVISEISTVRTHGLRRTVIDLGLRRDLRIYVSGMLHHGQVSVFWIRNIYIYGIFMYFFFFLNPDPTLASTSDPDSNLACYE